MSHDTCQGIIRVPLCTRDIIMHSLLIALSNHAYALNINSLSLPSPSFADDMLAIQPSLPKSSHANVLLLQLEVET